MGVKSNSLRVVGVIKESDDSPCIGYLVEALDDCPLKVKANKPLFGTVAFSYTLRKGLQWVISKEALQLTLNTGAYACCCMSGTGRVVHSFLPLVGAREDVGYMRADGSCCDIDDLPVKLLRDLDEGFRSYFMPREVED